MLRCLAHDGGLVTPQDVTFNVTDSAFREHLIEAGGAHVVRRTEALASQHSN